MRILSRLAIAFLLLGLVSCNSKPGVKKLQQSRDALRAATSWEEDVTVTDGGQQRSVLVVKVECPSRRDLMWTSPPSKRVLDNDGRVVVHDIWFDGNWYTSDGRVWHTFKGAQQNLPNKLQIGCGDGPMMVAEERGLSEVLDGVIRQGEIRPGPKMTENGYDCSWWDLSERPGQAPQFSVCINEPSHLPQVVRSMENGHEYTYTLSQWGSASVGLPPELL